LHDVVQLAGGKLPNRLRHSRAAHDHAYRNNRDLKRDIAHGVHNGLHFEPARMSDELLPRILPNRKIKTRRRPLPVVYSVIQVAMPPRRLPPPWSAGETDACFIVRDANGQALAYVYFEDKPGRRAAAKLLTRDEAHRLVYGVSADLDTRLLPEMNFYVRFFFRWDPFANMPARDGPSEPPFEAPKTSPWARLTHGGAFSW
jgi:hypothetical protein